MRNRRGVRLAGTFLQDWTRNSLCADMCRQKQGTHHHNIHTNPFPYIRNHSYLRLALGKASTVVAEVCLQELQGIHIKVTSLVNRQLLVPDCVASSRVWGLSNWPWDPVQMWCLSTCLGPFAAHSSDTSDFEGSIYIHSKSASFSAKKSSLEGQFQHLVALQHHLGTGVPINTSAMLPEKYWI